MHEGTTLTTLQCTTQATVLQGVLRQVELTLEDPRPLFSLFLPLWFRFLLFFFMDSMLQSVCEVPFFFLSCRQTSSGSVVA
jgi:hypothetical protein